MTEPGKAFMNRSTDSNCFDTPYSMTHQLLEVERFNRKLSTLEPACGNYAIADVLENHCCFFKVKPFSRLICYDIKKGINFLLEKSKFDYIITNPPYGELADEFVIHAKKLYKKKIAFLLRTNYLSGKKRFDKRVYNELKTVYVFTRMADLRCQLRPDGKYKTAGIVYAWFIWEKGYRGEPRIRHIDNQKYVLNERN